MDWWALYSQIIFSFTIFLCYRWLSHVWILELGVRISTKRRKIQNWELEKGKIRPSIANMEALSDLPEEVIMNIKSRLSVKFLCKLKCVSHNWLSCILFDSYMKNLQRCQSLKSPRLLSYEIKGFNCDNDSKKGKSNYCTICLTTTDIVSRQVIDEFDMMIARSLNESDNPFVQVSSCRDLICIFSDQEIVVCNPSNHEFKEICGNYGKNNPNSIGIGYLPSSGEYKVVRLYRSFISTLSNTSQECLGCQIFTIKENCSNHAFVTSVQTSNIDGFTFKPFDYRRPIYDRLPICVNGIMYWMMKHSYEVEENLAYYLDLENGSFGHVPCPKLEVVDKILLAYEDVKLLKIDGFLCLQCCLPMMSRIAFYALKDVKLGIWEKFLVISVFPSWDPRGGKANVLGALPISSSNYDHEENDELIVSQTSIEDDRKCYYLFNRRGLKRELMQDQSKGRAEILHFDGLFSFKRQKFSPTKIEIFD